MKITFLFLLILLSKHVTFAQAKLEFYVGGKDIVAYTTEKRFKNQKDYLRSGSAVFLSRSYMPNYIQSNYDDSVKYSHTLVKYNAKLIYSGNYGIKLEKNIDQHLSFVAEMNASKIKSQIYYSIQEIASLRDSLSSSSPYWNNYVPYDTTISEHSTLSEVNYTRLMVGLNLQSSEFHKFSIYAGGRVGILYKSSNEINTGAKELAITSPVTKERAQYTPAIRMCLGISYRLNEDVELTTECGLLGGSFLQTGIKITL